MPQPASLAARLARMILGMPEEDEEPKEPRVRTRAGETFAIRDGKMVPIDVALPQEAAATPQPSVEVGEPFDPNVDVAARTVYGEARGDPASQQAVAAVLLNRLAAQRQANPEATMADVAMAPNQFSAWNPGNPNRLAMLGAPPEKLEPLKAMVAGMMAHSIPDPTGGATLYHALSASPAWDWSKLEPVATLGSHAFYRKRKGKR